MIRLFTVMLLISISSVALSKTLYRWVDDDGRTHFSDQPQPGAEEITIKSPSTIETQKSPVSRPRPAPKATKEKEAFRYASLAVTQPAREQTLWNLGGVLNVSVSLQPDCDLGTRCVQTLTARQPTLAAEAVSS